ncbi:hypothetical protein WBP07_21050 (plasmid) [Novosphingobium sp. BL-8A]|uniref:hypothetical protein n=1 Tax=Novosphingobium sp. BL-8A TaxID=3127639 RepID=UPI0037570B3D
MASALTKLSLPIVCMGFRATIVQTPHFRLRLSLLGQSMLTERFSELVFATAPMGAGLKLDRPKLTPMER